MAWHDEADHPFCGIAEKLKRADQNIASLHDEISGFFEASKYPVMPDEDSEEWQDAIDYHKKLPVPIRFSVLCGEIVHQFRSSLDHIAWYFSDLAYRRDHENAILFPVLSGVSPTKDDLSRYERNVKGITNANVRKIIELLQPYRKGAEALDHPVCIVHDMDRFDKHRELAIISSCVSLSVPGASFDDLINAFRYSQGEQLALSDVLAAERTLKSNVKASPQVAFVKFGNRKTQPVVPSLQQLQNAMNKIVTLFAEQV